MRLPSLDHSGIRCSQLCKGRDCRRHWRERLRARGGCFRRTGRKRRCWFAARSSLRGCRRILCGTPCSRRRSRASPHCSIRCSPRSADWLSGHSRHRRDSRCPYPPDPSSRLSARIPARRNTPCLAERSALRSGQVLPYRGPAHPQSSRSQARRMR